MTNLLKLGRRLLLGSALCVVSMAVINNAQAISTEALQQGIPSLAPMLEEVTPAVVSIRVAKNTRIPTQYPSDQLPRGLEQFRRFFEPGNGQPPNSRSYAMGSGSGVIIDGDRGLLVTNHHVVDNADSITVFLADGSEYEAKLLGSDERTDLALLEIDARDLADIEMAEISTVAVGDYVVAIGNPFGIGQTVTSGIVSALGRAGINNANYEDFIQTDAAINVGNSGGALIDMEGRLVGINTAIISGSGGSNGIGFAIPANMLTSVVEHLVRDGEVRRGILGITMRDVDKELASQLELRTVEGVLVTNVLPGSGADAAGVEVFDVVTAVNGKPVKDGRSIRNLVGLMRLDQELELSVLRDGRERILNAVIAAAPNQVARLDARPDNFSTYVGAQLRSSERRDQNGVEVVSLEEGSPAWSAGLRVGDLVTQVNRNSVDDLREFNRRMNQSQELTALTVVREGREMVIFLG